MKNFAKVFLLCGMAVSVTLQANDYLPYGAGDLVRFQAMNGSEQRESSILSTQGNWKQLSDFLGLGEKWVYTEAGDSRIWVYNPLSGYGERMVDMAANVGQTFNTPLGECNSQAVIAERGASVTTPAGTFNSTVRVDFSGSCDNEGLKSVWFVRGIGPVQWLQHSIFGPLYYSMDAAAIGDILLPKLPELSVSASFPMGRVILNDHDSINASLTLSNTSADDVELTFPNGQTFDIFVIDGEGDVVRQWSYGQMFTQAIHSITIAAGASHSFGTELDLVDDAGQPLEVGSYVLRIEMTGYSTPDASVFRNEPIAVEAPLHLDSRMYMFGN